MGKRGSILPRVDFYPPGFSVGNLKTYQRKMMVKALCKPDDWHPLPGRNYWASARKLAARGVITLGPPTQQPRLYRLVRYVAPATSPVPLPTKESVEDVVRRVMFSDPS